MGSAIAGFVRGTIRQVASLVGFILGLWCAAWISVWVGSHWQGARPAIVFFALRWLIAGLGGLAVAALIAWIGEQASIAVKATPLGWLDRLGGLAIGAASGWVIAAVALVTILLWRWPAPMVATAEHARLRGPVLAGARQLCDAGHDVIPGSAWLSRQLKAESKRESQRAHSI